MAIHLLFHGAAILLAIGTLAHTLGGMLWTARKGVAAPEADRVLAEMRAVHFQWRGADATWFGFWMGNGLGVSALLAVTVLVLWTLGWTEPSGARPLLPLAWGCTAGLVAMTAVGVRYFATRVGAVFGLVAALSGAGSVLLTLAACSR